jgi:ribosomal protein L23
MIKNWIFLKQETDQLRKLQTEGKFVFNIHPELTKQEVKEWIEKSFSTQVLSVNSQRVAKKQKRRGRHIAYPIRYKTITVTVKLYPKKLKARLITDNSDNQPNTSQNIIKKEEVDTQKRIYDINIINF